MHVSMILANDLVYRQEATRLIITFKHASNRHGAKYRHKDTVGKTPVLFAVESREEAIASKVSYLKQTTIGWILDKARLIADFVEKLGRADVDSSGLAGPGLNFEDRPSQSQQKNNQVTLGAYHTALACEH